MNEWLLAAAVLGVALVPLVLVAVLSEAMAGLIALEVAGSITSAILILLAEGLKRPPFIDLAVILAPLALVGAIAYARLMERHL